MPCPILLSSSSASRKELMDRLHLPYVRLNPSIDETRLPQEDVREMVIRLSKEKAMVGSKKMPGHLSIGSDQVAFLPHSGQILGKPLSKSAAFEQLQLMSGQTVEFIAGLFVYNPISQKEYQGIDTTTIVLKTLSEEKINDYLDKEQPYHMAGSIKCEGLAISLFESYAASDPTTIIGFSLMRLVSILETERIL